MSFFPKIFVVISALRQGLSAPSPKLTGRSITTGSDHQYNPAQTTARGQSNGNQQSHIITDARAVAGAAFGTEDQIDRLTEALANSGLQDIIDAINQDTPPGDPIITTATSGWQIDNLSPERLAPLINTELHEHKLDQSIRSLTEPNIAEILSEKNLEGWSAIREALKWMLKNAYVGNKVAVAHGMREFSAYKRQGMFDFINQEIEERGGRPAERISMYQCVNGVTERVQLRDLEGVMTVLQPASDPRPDWSNLYAFASPFSSLKDQRENIKRGYIHTVTVNPVESEVS